MMLPRGRESQCALPGGGKVVLLHAADFIPNLAAIGFLQEQASHDERNAGHDHGVVQAGVNVMGALADIDAYERDQAAEDTIPDMVRQR